MAVFSLIIRFLTLPAVLTGTMAALLWLHRRPERRRMGRRGDMSYAHPPAGGRLLFSDFLIKK